MANKVQFKRTSVSGKIPTTADIGVGEIAINMADAKLYSVDANQNILDLNPVKSVFGRTGMVMLTAQDIINALGYVPFNPATALSGGSYEAGAIGGVPSYTLYGNPSTLQGGSF